MIHTCTQSVKPRPNDRNMSTQHTSQHCWAQHAACVWPQLRCVATCWVLLAQVWKWSNLNQQHPTYRNRVAKRTQHVAPNNVSTCRVGMLRSFGRGLTWSFQSNVGKLKAELQFFIPHSRWKQLRGVNVHQGKRNLTIKPGDNHGHEDFANHVTW